MYATKLILGSLKPDILEGLVSGRYQRYGGVIRMAAGQPHAGAIVTMLRELPGVRTAASAVGKTAEVGLALENRARLDTVLQLTQVASAASVVNLGISAAGFAIMAYKLHRLEANISQLIQIMAGQHEAVMGKLDDVRHQLVELKLLGTTNVELVHAAIDEVRNARKDLLDDHVAWLRTKLERMPATGPIADATLASAWERFTATRHWLEQAIEGAPVMREASPQWLDLLTRFRVWCFATTGEIQLARRATELSRAATLASDAATCARTWAERWREALAPAEQFGGVLRFEHHQFAELHDEPLARLRRLQPRTDGAPHRTTAATDVAIAASALGPAWFTQQLAIGRTLDFVEESVERIEALAAEAAWCHQHGLGVARWEDLAAPDLGHALAAIDVRELA